MLAVLWCGIALAALVMVGQNPPSSSSSTTDSGQPQQPQNPLQTAPTTQTEQPPKPPGATFELGSAASGGKDQELGEVRLMTRYTQIGGDESKSFYVPGENNLAEFNYFLDRHFLDTRRLQVLGMFRGTDDESIDPTHNSLQKGYLRLYGPRDEYIVGDALVNFSRLSFNQNIRGLDTSWKLGDKWKLTTVGGVFIDRWNSIWQAVPGRPYLSSVAGSRLEYRPTKRATLGLNFSFSKDNVGTLPEPCNPFQAGQGACEIGAVPSPADNKVGSADLKLQFPWGLRMDAEYAYSLTDFDIRQPVAGYLLPICNPSTPALSPCYLPCPQIDTRAPVPGCGTQGDWGARTEATYRWHKLTLRGSFVRFQPNFASMNARQVSDLQDGVFRASYDLTHFLTLDGTIRRSNNNLRDQLTATPTGYETVLWGPEMHFILHDLSFYRRAILEFGYRDREVHGTRPTLGVCAPTLPGVMRMTCLDQSVRMPFGELSVPYHTTYLTVGYEMRGLVDNIDPAQSAHVHRVYAALRGLYELGGWHINPNFRFELERQSQRPNQDLGVCNPALGLADPCLLTYDSNRLDTAAVLAEAPRWFIFELGFRATTATIFGPSGYSRPSYRAALTYKIRNDENMVLIFSFLRNSYFFLTPPNLTPITDYDERQMGVTFVYKFGKRR